MCAGNRNVNHSNDPVHGNAVDGNRWSNIYSKHLLRVLYGRGGDATDANENDPGPSEVKAKENRSRSESIGKKATGGMSKA